MTLVDWVETLALVGLSRLAFANRRADFFVVFSLLLGNAILGRLAIALAEPETSVIVITLYQSALTAACAARASGAAGGLIGAMFALMLSASGLTLAGLLDPVTSIGPAANFWTAMTALSFGQYGALAMAHYTSGQIWKFKS